MPDSTISQQLVRLARASSRSAEALGRALTVVDDEDWQDQLSQTYPERVELFEMCVRCLVAADTSPHRIREALQQGVSTTSPDPEVCIDDVLATELVLEAELQSALTRSDWRDPRMPEVLGMHLLRSQSFRSECVTLAENGPVAGAALGQATAGGVPLPA